MSLRVDKSDPEFKIRKARGTLIDIQPFFGTLALRLLLTPIENQKICPVMATDGRSLFYNPAAVRAMPQQQVMGVVAHEVLHCAFQHVYRRRHRQPQKWNKATDYVINEILLQERFSLPEGRLFNPKFANMSAEEVYEKLPDEPPNNGGGNSQNDWDFGSCLDPSLPDPETGKQRSSAAIDKASKDWEIATKQAAEIAKQQGKLPGNFAELIDELLQPQIPWRQHLWRFMNQRKPDRITWNRPNRRLAGSGLYLPARKYVPTGDIVVGIDTSGSVTSEELQTFASELEEIHKSLQPTKLWVLDIDTKIHRVKEYGPLDKLDIQYFGRGGTEFDPLFDWVEQNNINPDAIVYLTDGYAQWPQERTQWPTLWCITNTEMTPPWGEVLRLEPGGF